MLTPEALKAYMMTLKAVAEAIRDAREIPAGHLYASLMDKMSLDTFNGMIRLIKDTGCVVEQNHLLKWIGPVNEKIEH